MGAERGMSVHERELYRTTRGPTPSDEESWHLVFDPDTKRLVVRRRASLFV